MEKIMSYKEFDELQYKSFSNIDEFKELLDKCIDDFKKELEQKYTNIEFDRFEFSYDYVLSCGDSDNYRPTLCVYFKRDETAVEKARREEIEEQTRKRKEQDELNRQEMQKKMEEAEYQNYLRLKEKYGQQFGYV